MIHTRMQSAPIRNVDDASPQFAAALRAERLAQTEWRFQIQLKILIPLFQRRLHHSRFAEPRGAIDQDMNRSHCAIDVGYQCHPLIIVHQIGLKQLALLVFSSNESGDALRFTS